jgi:hypothetical protein
MKLGKANGIERGISRKMPKRKKMLSIGQMPLLL